MKGGPNTANPPLRWTSPRASKVVIEPCASPRNLPRTRLATERQRWPRGLMVSEIAQVVLEEILGKALSGVFRGARSPKARLLKWCAWMSLVVAIACFVMSGVYAIAVAAIAGGVLVVLFFAFGIWAAAVNASLRADGG